MVGDRAVDLSLTLDDCIDLVDWTGRQLQAGKRGVIAEDAPRLLRRFGSEPEWTSQVLGIESRYWRAIGSAQALLENAVAEGQRWLKGPRAIAIAVR